MLEQLVGRCLEQGYMECQEGKTIEAQRAQQVCHFFYAHSFILISFYKTIAVNNMSNLTQFISNNQFMSVALDRKTLSSSRLQSLITGNICTLPNSGWHKKDKGE